MSRRSVFIMREGRGAYCMHGKLCGRCVMKKVIVWLLVGVMVGIGTGWAEPSVVSAAAVLIDGDTGRVLWGQNMDKLLPMASTTKIMTALVVLENADLEATVTIPKLASGIPGTSIYLSEGETLTVLELLKGLLLRSGNDAAVALADYTGGSVERFVEMMNEKAAALGVDAGFANPHGLDAEGHAASARAMALIAREALKNPTFAEIVSTQRAVIPWDGNEYSRVLQSKNRLLWEYEGATGVKTGYTGRAGRCLVFSAEREGVELIGAVMNCGAWFDEATEMLDWGFGRYERRRALARGDPVGTVKALGRAVAVSAGEDVYLTLEEGDRVDIVLEPMEGLRAPLMAGEPVGMGHAAVNGAVVKDFLLRAETAVEDHSYGSCLKRVAVLWAVRRQDTPPV